MGADIEKEPAPPLAEKLVDVGILAVLREAVHIRVSMREELGKSARRIARRMREREYQTAPGE
jgi:hypothetical protein